MKQVYHKMKDH